MLKTEFDDHSDNNQENLAAYLESLSAPERIQWAARRHNGTLGLTASFGIQSAVLLHMVKIHAPDTKIIFVDTQHLHPETYRYKRDLIELLDLNVLTYRADMSRAEQEALFGERWKDGVATDEYKAQNKVAPLNRAITELGITGWVAGLRRQQSAERSDRPAWEMQGRTEKVYPIIDWHTRDVYNYMKEHGLPQHPLWEKGYTTIGDFFEDPTSRTECGAHDQRIGRNPDEGIEYVI